MLILSGNKGFGESMEFGTNGKVWEVGLGCDLGMQNPTLVHLTALKQTIWVHITAP